MNKEQDTELNEFIDRIWPVYVILDWTWGTDEPPSKKELKNQVLYLIDRLNESKKSVTSIATGGLYADRYDGIVEYGMHIYGSCFEEPVKKTKKNG